MYIKKIRYAFLMSFLLTNLNLNAQTITDPWMSFFRYRPNLVLTDGLGNVYAVSSNKISKVTSTGVVTQEWATLANDAIPVGIAIDGSGNIYTSNNAINTISKVTSTGVVTQAWATLASNARPSGITIDGSGNVYTANQGNGTISKVTPAGLVTQAWATFVSDNNFSRIAIDGSGNVYKTNWTSGTVSKITSTGIVTQTWASGVGNSDIVIDGSGNVYTISSINSTISKITSTGVVTQAWVTLASGTRPSGIAIDGSGNIYTSNNAINTISKVTSTGVLTQTWATLASDAFTRDLAIDGSGNIYTANEGNSSISKVTSSGLVTEDWATLPKLRNPKIVAIDNNGNLNVSFTNTLATISPLGTITQQIEGIQTQAIAIDKANNIYTNNNNSVISFVNSSGVADINWAKLKLSSSPVKLAIDGSGNMYSANQGNNTISKVTPAGLVYQVWATLASGSDQSLRNGANPTGIAIDGSGNVYTCNIGDNTVSKVTSAGVVTQAWATLATDAYPAGIIIDGSGTIYTLNSNNTISKITPLGVVTQAWATLATNPYSNAIAIDGSGNLYTINGNSTISKITPLGVVTQSWATLATNAQPYAIAIDGSGNIYTSNVGNSTISKVTSSGIVTQAWATLANNVYPYFIAIDGLGNVYTCNIGNNTVSKITSSGVVTQAFANLASGDIATDGSGNLYMANSSKNTISKITSTGVVTQAWATLISGAYPSGLAIDNSGNVFTANTTNNTISKVTTGGILTQAWATLAAEAKPYAIVFDGSGNLYTANGNNTISKITPLGVVTQAWATLASDAIPGGIIIDQLGNLYTSNNGNSTISKITTPSGVVTQAWATLGSGANQIAIVFDQLGNIYSCIAKTGNNTISKINSNGVVTQIYVDQFSYIDNQSITVDKKNDVYVVNRIGQKIIKISNCNTSIPTPVVTSLNATSFCQGGVDTLLSNATTGNQWYLNGNSIQGATNTSYIANASGNYTVVASNSGCISGVSSATTITVIPLPQTPIITSLNATSFCQGGVDTLLSNATTGNQWYLNGKSINGATGVSFIANASGNYSDSVTNASGCKAGSFNITILVNPIPSIPKITRDSLNFLVASGIKNLWFRGEVQLADTVQRYKPALAGSYAAKTISNGCLSGLSSPYFYLVTDIINLSSDEFIKLAPNPFVSQLNFDFVIKGYQRLNIEIFDIASGSKVALKQNVTPGTPIYLEHLTSGNYLIKVTSNDQKIHYQFKMVKL